MEEITLAVSRNVALSSDPFRAKTRDRPETEKPSLPKLRLLPIFLLASFPPIPFPFSLGLWLAVFDTPLLRVLAFFRLGP